MRNLLFIAGLLSIFFSSCVSSAALKTNDHADNLPPGNPGLVEVFSTEKASKPYILLGEVIASADSATADVPVNLLKKRAAELGADAIVNLRLQYMQGVWTVGLNATATAVKYLDQ